MATKQYWEVCKKIVAIGRNYAQHAKELGNAVPTKPFFFLKPTSSFVRQGQPILIPPSIGEVHHEVELGVVIGKKGKDIKAENAFDYVSGYTIALDLTARDIQQAAKTKGMPWTEAKGYDTFTPIGDFIPKDKIPDPSNVELYLEINGKIKQKGSTKDMIFQIPQLIEAVSKVMTLEEGDIILTGTPEGVGPMFPGEKVKAGITGITEIQFDIKSRSSL
eukprot:TRINITY_DN18592_c0_g1_i1.p1 TRINITY_DN18592_c0_g1~~TRINITY_DN18592_c0_g1_i1.p1  ORF type:complete len:219 (-),score=68.86 TRINITY_DN18592_c0_g1_i1:215-871(-)